MGGVLFRIFLTFGEDATYTHSFYGDSVFSVLGPTPADAIREIERLVDIGVSHFQINFDDMLTFRRFVDEVVPAVRLERRYQASGTPEAWESDCPLPAP